ncbi:MAG: hypothetical protein KIT45_13240 [Fimbriimonadia bacterium]|nr:hypothetical protein [Fimbriimonadia bacterium]
MKLFNALVWGGVVLLMSVRAFSQEAVTLSPADNAVIGWGRSTPGIQITAALQSEKQPTLKPRQFMTAILKDEKGKLVDRVSLYDDGSHSDQKEDDGIFTAVYYPSAPGSLFLQARAQWQDGARSREAWSQDSEFKVEYVPYPHIVYPEPGGQVGMSAKLRARLLLNGKPYEEEDSSLKAKAWTVASGNAGGEVQSAETVARRGSLLETPIQFSERGDHTVHVTVTVERGGMILQSEPASSEVDVAMPPTTLLWLGMALIIAYFIPQKPGVSLYTHELEARDADTGQMTTKIEVKPNVLENVKHTIGGEGANTKIEGLDSVLCSLISKPGVKSLTVQAEGGKTLEINSTRQSSATLKEKGEKFKIGNYEFELKEAASRRHEFSRFHPTPLKIVLAVAGIASLVIGYWQYTQFFQK